MTVIAARGWRVSLVVGALVLLLAERKRWQTSTVAATSHWTQRLAIASVCSNARTRRRPHYAGKKATHRVTVAMTVATSSFTLADKRSRSFRHSDRYPPQINSVTMKLAK